MPTSLRTVDVNKIELTDLSVTTGAAGASALAYDNTTGGFTFTPVNMNGLTDVDTTGVTQGQTLLYDSGTSSWIVGDSVGGLAAANTETDNVKSTLTYDSATGTFTFDFGNLFTANGVRTDAIIGTAATAMTVTAGDDLTLTAPGNLYLVGQNGTVDINTSGGSVMIQGSVYPDADQSWDIGGPTEKWSGGYFGEIYASTTYTSTVQSEAGTLSLEGFNGFVYVTSSSLQVEGNLLVSDADSYDIGTSGTRWLNIYGGTIDAATNVNSAALSVTGLSTLTGGVLANGEIQVGVTASNEIDTVSANLILDSATGLTQVDDDMQVTGSLTVTGDLVINGTSTTVNSTTITIDDPIMTLGGDTALASNDALDKGIEFQWHDGAAAKVGFFGYDESAGKFTFIADATNTSETFTGTAGDVVFGAGSFTTVTASTSLGVGSDWTVALNGANLQFLYQGTVVAQIDSTGQIDAKQDVIADSSSI